MAQWFKKCVIVGLSKMKTILDVIVACFIIAKWLKKEKKKLLMIHDQWQQIISLIISLASLIKHSDLLYDLPLGTKLSDSTKCEFERTDSPEIVNNLCYLKIILSTIQSQRA